MSTLGVKRLALAVAVLVLFAGTASAQTFDLNNVLPQTGGTATGRIVQLVGLLTVLSIAPGLLVMVTSFTRFAIAFSFLRSGLGLQTTPANLILISLSLFMTFYVMAPTFDQSWQSGLKPLMDNQLSEAEAFPKIIQPFRDFMLAQVRDKDLKLFNDLAKDSIKTTEKVSVDLRILIPAFMISEIRRGFEIGFLIVLAVSRYRHGGGDHHHVDGHDDAVAHRHIAADEGPVLRAGRWLEHAGRQPHPVLFLT